jgi:type IV secretion system protein VirB10
METPEDLTPFMTGEHIDPPERLKAWLLYGVIGAVGFLVILAIFLGVRSLTAPPPAPAQVSNDTPAMTAPVPPLEPTLKMPITFAGLDRRPPEPKPDAPPIPRAEKLAEITPPAEEKPPPPPAQKEPETRKDPERQVQTATAAPPQKPAPKRWLFAATDQKIGKPVFPLPTRGETGGHQEPEGKTDGSLIHAARWERPVDPTRIVYRDQRLHGLLLETGTSEVPGDLKLYIDRPVTDVLNQGVVLIPQHSIAIVSIEGKTAPGQRRLPAKLEQIRFPTGELVTFKGQAGDKSGAVGLTGTVNNHYGRIVGAAVISAVLSIGARVPFQGSASDFRPTLEEEFSRDVSRDLNRSGQEILRRSLPTGPTITVPAAYEASLQLQENVSFAREPKLVK